MKGAEIINETRGAYEILPHDLIMDNSISKMARFIYIYMSAKPSDWKFYKATMLRELEMSENTLNKYMNELIGSGWLEKLGQENNGGKFGCVKYVIKASKIASRKICVTQNLSDIHNTDIKQNTDYKKPCNNIENKKEIEKNHEDAFEAWYNVYDKKVDKAAAKKIWMRMKESEMQTCIDCVRAYVEANPEKQYRRSPARYLRNRTWEDEIITNKVNCNDRHYITYEDRREIERQQRMQGYSRLVNQYLEQARQDRIARGLDVVQSEQD